MKHDGNKYDQSSISSKAVYTTDMRETEQAPELAIAQIDMLLHESEHAIETMVSAITAMAGCVQRLEEKLTTAGNSTATSKAEDSIYKECTQAKDNMQQAGAVFSTYQAEAIVRKTSVDIELF